MSLLFITLIDNRIYFVQNVVDVLCTLSKIVFNSVKKVLCDTSFSEMSLSEMSFNEMLFSEMFSCDVN